MCTIDGHVMDVLGFTVDKSFAVGSRPTEVSLVVNGALEQGFGRVAEWLGGSVLERIAVDVCALR